MTTWKLWHLIRYFCTLPIIFLVALFSNIGLTVIGFLLGFSLFIVILIFLHSVRCPKCHKRFDGSENIFSPPEDKQYLIRPKNCVKCGFNFNQKNL